MKFLLHKTNEHVLSAMLMKVGKVYLIIIVVRFAGLPMKVAIDNYKGF